MLTEDVHVFVQKINGLNRLDDQFYKRLTTHFSKRLPSEEINKEDIAYLVKCFKIRSKRIIDTHLDYMCNLEGVNQAWIELARKMGEYTQKHYLHILMPHIKNTIDFNNLSQLTETNQFDNFYLGENGKILYRKRGLCEHLLEKNYILSTCRDLNSRTLSALSINELSRLNATKQKKEFSIGAETFYNFWHFLEKKVFPRLQTQASMPLLLLPYVIDLIESYYRHKTDKLAFYLFKEEFLKFAHILYRFKLEQINYFYGIPVQHKGIASYMLNLLIEINQASSYTLDACFDAMAETLFRFNRALIAQHSALMPIYDACNAKSRIIKKPTSAKQWCLNMLLSLFVTDFDLLPFSGGSIALWDIKNSVIFEAIKIYALFESALIDDRADELVKLYNQALTKFIRPALLDKSVLTTWTRFGSSDRWLRRVNAHVLGKIGIIWYEPEVILHVLMRYQMPIELAPDFKEFIDQLIHAYTQDKSELLKQFRTNILFYNFIQNLPTYVVRHLRLLMELYEPQQEVLRGQFMKNCISHIVRQLLIFNQKQTAETQAFFETAREIDLMKFDASPRRSNLLKFFVSETKENLYKSQSYFEKVELNHMVEYLRNLTISIPTVKEREDLLNSVDNLGYLGAPT